VNLKAALALVYCSHVDSDGLVRVSEMALSSRQQQQIIETIQQRAQGLGSCTLCNRAQWVLANGLVILSLSENLEEVSLGGPSLPCAALVCQNCGNTLLINLVTLGLTDAIRSAALAR
jgi:hypothetical protein